ncbi:energy transducer TonB [uncultured Porphyromonas sp.]|uniref:energy transducer TonB n=1 Tax=uncultured Porphyromonas sp. TaxID=159274 RepID=UPI0026366840|nr:energy transducer TonB [uncultured Porphyromonas sp.]
MHITRTALCPLLLLVGGLSLTQLASGSVPIQISSQSTLPQPDKLKVGASTLPSFPGGLDSLRAYLEQRIVYPKEALQKKIQGQVLITFVVQPDGQLSDMSILRGADLPLDKEAMRVVRSMPRWVPGKENGIAVAKSVTIPITFKLPTSSSATYAPNPTSQREAKSQEVEDNLQPMFPGGDQALIAYMSDNLVYPEEAVKKQLQGRLLVRFVVEPDGQLSQVGIHRSIHPLLDAEAVRMVKSMPRWIPARNNGVAVAAPMMLPITFKLPSQGLASLVDCLQKSNVKQVTEPDSIPVIDENNTDIERPLFPGGDQGFYDFLRSKLEYPEVEYRNRNQGEVHLRFVVDVDGSISQVTVVKGTSPAFDQAALDVMKLAPKFIPARKDGKPIQAWHYVVIRFFP